MLRNFLERYLPLIYIVSICSCQPEEEKRVVREEQVLTTIIDERDVVVKKNIFNESTEQFKNKSSRKKTIKIEHKGEIYTFDADEIMSQMNALEKYFEKNPEHMELLKEKLKTQTKDSVDDIISAQASSKSRNFVYNKIEAGHGRGLKLLIGLIIGVAITILVNIIIIIIIISLGGPFFVFGF